MCFTHAGCVILLKYDDDDDDDEAGHEDTTSEIRQKRSELRHFHEPAEMVSCRNHHELKLFTPDSENFSRTADNSKTRMRVGRVARSVGRTRKERKRDFGHFRSLERHADGCVSLAIYDFLLTFSMILMDLGGTVVEL